MIYITAPKNCGGDLSFKYFMSVSPKFHDTPNDQSYLWCDIKHINIVLLYEIKGVSD